MVVMEVMRVVKNGDHETERVLQPVKKHNAQGPMPDDKG